MRHPKPSLLYVASDRNFPFLLNIKRTWVIGALPVTNTYDSRIKLFTLALTLQKWQLALNGQQHDDGRQNSRQPHSLSIIHREYECVSAILTVIPLANVFENTTH